MMILYCCLFNIFYYNTQYFSISTHENKKHPPPKMQTHNESMTSTHVTQLMLKNTHAKISCLPARGIEGREKGQ